MARKEIIETDSEFELLLQAPWAADWVKVEGGYMAFEDIKDAEIFRAATEDEDE